jgi:3-oxoacyl-[acyl-carrier protein] reductase
MRLKDKVALVVGGGQGIGRSSALELAREGARLVIVDPGGSREGRPDQTRPAEAVAAECRALGAEVVAHHGDATDFAAAGRIVEQTVRDFGRLDILVNCAGVLREKMIWNMSEEDWDAVIAVHLKSCFNFARHASAVMRERRAGRIVLMTSAAWLATVGQSNYGAAKGAIWSFTRALARELGRYGVTCNAVCPTAATRMTMDDKVKEGFRKRLEKGLITQARYDALMNMGGPEFIGPLVAWLCTDAAADLNGQTLRVMQGRVAIFQEPFEKISIVKDEDNGLFTLDDFDRQMSVLMAGVTNPAPRQNEAG